MDEKSRKLTSTSLNFRQLYRRLRHQGTTQWITLLLIVSGIGLFMVSTPLNSYVYRRGQYAGRPQKTADDEPGNGNALVGEAGSLPDGSDDINDEETPVFSGSGFWDGVDWDEPLEVPERYTKKLPKLEVENGVEDIEVPLPNGDLQVFTIFFQETIPEGTSKGDVLLLHTVQYHSDTWVKVDTLKILAAMGYRATAIDLPGFGHSQGSVLMGHRAVTFISSFLQTHEMKSPMIIAPGMAGSYAFPFVMSAPHQVRALIAISPTSLDKYSGENYRDLKVPLLLLYGSRERAPSKFAETLLSNSTSAQVKTLPASTQNTIYVDQPDEFHRLMYVVISRLEAYEAKLAQARMTIVRPPVVTLDPAETPPPEVIMNLRGDIEVINQTRTISNETWADWFGKIRDKYGIDENGQLTIPLTDLSYNSSSQQSLQTLQLNPAIITSSPEEANRLAESFGDYKMQQAVAQPLDTLSLQKEFDKVQELAAVASVKAKPQIDSHQSGGEVNRDALPGEEAAHSTERPVASVVRNMPNVPPEMMRQHQFMSSYPEGMDEKAFLKAQSDAAMKSVGQAQSDLTPAPYFVQRPGSATQSSEQSKGTDDTNQQLTHFAQQPQIAPLVPPQTTSNKS
ncbi:hypothetical protein RvY_03544 [Ramazzottius varieornatus]|uniref:AB hydrolase-1 domain-containing protein n=1 Tax=Ramazzottius varieornatus TaxID=947166 RepID=A0A1D1UYL0_RAMVA|nr:hypothetical protein RvY_03544 [Ramazzottius varieornatus]